MSPVCLLIRRYPPTLNNLWIQRWGQIHHQLPYPGRVPEFFNGILPCLALHQPKQYHRVRLHLPKRARLTLQNMPLPSLLFRKLHLQNWQPPTNSPLPSHSLRIHHLPQSFPQKWPCRTVPLRMRHCIPPMSTLIPVMLWIQQDLVHPSESQRSPHTTRLPMPLAPIAQVSSKRMCAMRPCANKSQPAAKQRELSMKCKAGR